MSDSSGIEVELSSLIDSDSSEDFETFYCRHFAPISYLRSKIFVDITYTPYVKNPKWPADQLDAEVELFDVKQLAKKYLLEQ